MSLDTVLRSQFGKPSGPVASLFMAPLMNFANMRLVNTTIDLLEPGPKDRVLDIGFGGGHSLLRLAGMVKHGKIIGVDYSPEMVKSAKELMRGRPWASRVSVKCADAADLPFRAHTFDKILTVNSIYYWPNLSAGLREAARVMKQHGRIAVGFRSATSLRPFTRGWKDFSLYEPREFADILENAGFKLIAMEHRDRWRIQDMVIAVGERR